MAAAEIVRRAQQNGEIRRRGDHGGRGRETVVITPFQAGPGPLRDNGRTAR
jgi:hypothetical protein